MFSERLQRAIDRSGHSVRQTGISLSERGVPGASYGNIRRMLAGDAEKAPTVDFIEAAATFLGVRRAWLAFGDGAMTEEEEAAREGAAHLHEQFDAAAHRMREGVLTGYGVPTAEEIEKGEAGPTASMAASHRRSGLRAWVVPALQLAGVASLSPEELGQALRVPLEAVNRNLRAGPYSAVHLSPVELDAYTLAMIAALLGIALPRGASLRLTDKALEAASDAFDKVTGAGAGQAEETGGQRKRTGKRPAVIPPPVYRAGADKPADKPEKETATTAETDGGR